MSRRYAIIMAGGSGTRFWPESRTKRPKQLLDLLGQGKNLLRLTYERTARIVPSENIFIVTGRAIAAEVKDTVPELVDENILREPVGRNTAPCIGWACNRISARDPEGLVAVFPSDHHVQNEEEFIRIIDSGLTRVAGEDRIITIGIRPSRPETGYGYVEGGSDVGAGIRQVRRFVEKPDRSTAEVYVEKGNFFWNGGIFIFRAMRMLEEIRRHLPATFSALKAIQEAFAAGGLAGETETLAEVFPGIKGISIDYGVMEKASDVEVIPADFGWSDLGSWRAIFERLAKDENDNAVRGNCPLLSHGAKRCLASAGGEKVVALVGVDNLVVVDTPDALLVCSMENDQDVREIVARLKEKHPHRT